MDLLEYWNKFGHVATLKKMGYQRLAKKVSSFEKKKLEILEKEGVIPFDKRSKKSQKILTQASEIFALAEKVIFGN